MNFLHNVFYKLFVEVEAARVPYLLVENLLPSLRLEDGHIVSALDGADVLRNLHTLAEQFQHFCVDDVELLAKAVKVAWGDVAVCAYLQSVEQRGQLFGSNLLLAVGEGRGRLGVAFYHQSVVV